MKIWSTFRLVPPISPEAFAWCVMSFATFLAVYETEPVLLGQRLDPLAMALAVQLTLILVRNATSRRMARTIAKIPVIAGVMILSALAGLGCLALFGTGAFAAKLIITGMLLNAFCLTWGSAWESQYLQSLPSSWLHLKKNREGAMLIEAGGMVVSVATLLMVWQFAGPMAFAVMMGFGVIYVRMLTDWVIVLLLLDAANGGFGQSD